MKRGLGRGLDSLFGGFEDDDDEVVEASSKTEKTNKGAEFLDSVKNATYDTVVGFGANEKPQEKTEKVEVLGKPVEIELGLIDRNPAQPRTNFDEEALNELANSIKVHGVIQPIIVKKNDDRYIIIAGERRWRATRLAGLKTIPCLIKDYTEQEMSEIAIIENLQRENLNPIESAKAIKNLINEYKLTQDEVADKIGKSRPVVANTLRLLSLPDTIITLVETNKLSAGHARALLAVTDSAKQKELAITAIQKGLSVREMENLVRFANMPQNAVTSQSANEKSPELKEFERKLKRSLGTRVQIKGDDQKGKIVIDYYSSDDLNRIYELLSDK